VGFSSAYAALAQDPSIPAFTGIVGGADNGGMGTTQASAYGPFDTNHDFNVSMAQMWKNHSFRYGWEYIVQQQADGSLGASSGTFDFGQDNSTKGDWTSKNPAVAAGTGEANPIADMLLSLPSNVTSNGTTSIPTNATAFWSQHFTAFYFQDDWKQSSKLTLNLGLRWDVQVPITERFNRYYSRYDPNGAQTAVTTSAQPNLCRECSGRQWRSQYRHRASAGISSGSKLACRYWHNPVRKFERNPRSAVNTRYKYFQPRIGFAYQLRPNTVLRGGIGRFVQSTYYTGNTSHDE
jgi:outer membrane receptor protein involved in Fe transport